MKEVSSIFGSEVYRPFVTLVLPGAIGAFPWFVAVMDRSEFIRGFIGARPPEATMAFILATVFLGHLCEDLGSRIETFFDDARGKRQPEHKVEWYRYLRRAYKIEPIGHRYMRTLVLRLKFELNSLPALLSVAAGVWFTHTSEAAKCLVTTGALILMAYLSWEASSTHDLLGELRHELLSSPIELVPEAQKEDSQN